MAKAAAPQAQAEPPPVRPWLTEPNRPQALADIVEALQRAGVPVSYRMLDDAIRTEADLPMPKPFGMIGRNRLWDVPLIVAALPALAQWFNDAPERRAQRHRETLAAQKAAHERSVADKLDEFQQRMKAVDERHQFFREVEENAKAEQEGRKPKRGGAFITPPLIGGA